MTVLQVCAFGAPRPGNFIATLASLEWALKERGIRTVYALAETAKGKDWCNDICKRAKVYFIPVKHARILPETYRQFKKIYSENDISIVHTHFELYDIPATITAPKDSAIFWHLHDPIKDNYNNAKLTRKLLYKLQYGVFGKKAKLLSVSKEHADFAVSLGFLKERVYYVPNGIDTNRISESNCMEKDDVFLIFGWDVLRKGLDLAIEAECKLPGKFRIIAVGQESCKEYLGRTPTKHVSFSYPVDDVNKFYSVCKAFLHVSRAEGLSYALIEAIYAGLIVICSDIPENQIAREFAGIRFVRSGESDDIRDAMQDVLDGKITLSIEECKMNRSLIDNKYSLNAWLATIQSLYALREGEL